MVNVIFLLWSCCGRGCGMVLMFFFLWLWFVVLCMSFVVMR